MKRHWRSPLNALKVFTGGTIAPISVTLSGSDTKVTEPRISWEIYLASFVINLLALGLPLVTLQVYDRVIPNFARETLLFLVLALVIVILVDLGLRTARSALLSWFAITFVRTVERESITRLLYAPRGTVEREPTAVHVNRVAALAALGNYHASSSRLTAIELPFVLVTLAIMFLVGGLIALVPIALFFFFAAVAIRRSQHYREINEERSIQDNKKYDFVSEVLDGILTVKCMAMESQMLRRFERLQQSTAEITMRFIHVSHAAQTSAVTYGGLSQIAIVALGSIAVIDGRMSIGALACCTMLSGQILQPLLRSISLWTENEVMRHRREEVRKLLDLKPVDTVNVPTRRITGAISFNQVSFERPGQQRSMLRDISLSIPAGTIVGLVGDDISGCQTLLRLVLGDLTPTNGRITIDDIASTDSAFAGVRAFVTYVGPKPVIFRGTVLDNITNFESTRRNFARQMAILIGLEESLNELPKGYDTMLGENLADSVPPSLAQQITIARALASGPRVLLLEDVSAVLDHRADAALISAMDKLRGSLTLMVTTYRPSVLAKSDIVYALTDGQLVRHQLAKARSPQRGVA
jgi:ATP-binding cassette subfamily C protein LapB